jgi:hypothetical protein
MQLTDFQGSNHEVAIEMTIRLYGMCSIPDNLIQICIMFTCYNFANELCVCLL